MNQALQTFMKTPDAQKKLTILAGQDLTKPLSAATKEKLSRAYFKLYFGLSCVNWSYKKSLGAAWQSALGQIDAYISAKKQDNPAVIYLRQVNAAHKSAWPKNIMTHPQRDTKLNSPDPELQQWRRYGSQNIQSAMGEIAILLAQHEIEINNASSIAMAAPEKNTMAQSHAAINRTQNIRAAATHYARGPAPANAESLKTAVKKPVAATAPIKPIPRPNVINPIKRTDAINGPKKIEVIKKSPELFVRASARLITLSTQYNAATARISGIRIWQIQQHKTAGRAA